MTHQKNPPSNRQEHQKPSASGNDIGGREFGQVIDPTQAQMASENEGLTDNSAGQPHQQSTKKESAKKRRKAA